MCSSDGEKMLEINNLHVEIDGKEIIKGLNLKIKSGEIHAMMGPNGSGKSTLSNTLMGHPKYKITKGHIIFNGKDITLMKPNERAKIGMFLSFQYPAEIPGVTLANFLFTAYKSLHGNISPLEFNKVLKEKMEFLKFGHDFARRHLNDGFSGGEKKRCEILQMTILNPKLAILDETDSGLDIDALKIVANGINAKDKETSVLLITHYQRILKYVNPDFVHVYIDGKIVKSGGHELADELEITGYEQASAKTF